MSNAEFVNGIRLYDKHENAPDFVLFNGVIKVAELTQWLAGKPQDADVRFDIKRGQSGKPYISVNDYKPKDGEQRRERPARQQAPAQQTPAGDFEDDDIPF